MDLRPFEPADRAACLAVFDTLDIADRRREFETYLDKPTGAGFVGAFFVMEHEGAIVGCGGYSVRNEISALQWGMIRRDSQKMGLGRFLLLYRLREIGRAGAVSVVIVQTPPESARFFEKQGFKTVSTNATTVELTKKMVVCA